MKVKKALFFLLISVMPLIGQTGQAKKIDDTLAIVGNQPLLQSEFQAIYKLYASQYRPDTITDPAMRENIVKQLKAQVFQDLLTSKLFYVAALKDTMIKVTDDQVEEQLQQFIDNIKNQIGENGFNKILKNLGTNLEGFKSMMRWYIREQLYAQQYIETHVKPRVQISPQEVDSLYNLMKDSLVISPEMVRVAHILIAIKPTDAEVASAKKTAMQIYNRLINGADFAQTASSYSDDRETAQNGGYIGVIHRNMLSKDMASKIFALPPGGISKPIRGNNGYNIFKCHNKKGDQIELSYILVKYPLSRSDTLKALKLAQNIMQALKNGASFDSLAALYSDDSSTKDLGGDLGWIQLNMLPSPLKDSLENMKPGEIKGPILTGMGYHIVKLIDRQEAQKATREQFAQMLYQKKFNDALQAEFQKLSKDIYLKIKVDPANL